jgi:large subunit ribosomal protein L17
VQHGKKTVKLGRTTSHRDAMLANMATSLLLHEKITTTTVKAKALRPMVDRLITVAKKGNLHSQRQVARTIKDKEALKKLFKEIVPKLDDRVSGFSRVLRAGFRQGDGAELAIVELLIERPAEVSEKKKEGRLKRLTGKLKKSGGKTATESRRRKKAGKKAEVTEEEAEVEESVDSPEEPEEEATPEESEEREAEDEGSEEDSGADDEEEQDS